MRKLTIAAALLVLCTGTAQAADEAECQAAWLQADRDGNGVLAGAEAERYEALLRLNGRKMPPVQRPADGTITRGLFLEACRADVFAAPPADQGSPAQPPGTPPSGARR